MNFVNEDLWGTAYKLAAKTIKLNKPTASIRKPDESLTFVVQDTLEEIISRLMPNDHHGTDSEINGITRK